MTRACPRVSVTLAVVRSVNIGHALSPITITPSASHTATAASSRLPHQRPVHKWARGDARGRGVGGRARRREEGRKPLGTPCLTPLCEPLCQTVGTELAPAPRGKLTAEHQVTLESGRAGFDQGRELRSGLICEKQCGNYLRDT